MSVTFKAFLHERTWRSDPIEIRRFNVDQDVSTSYAYLLQKLNQIFPSLTTNNVIVAWTDADGDLIVISSDEELVQALDQFEGSLFRLFLLKKNTADSTQTGPTSGAETTQTPKGESTSSPSGPQQPRVHIGVICDGCSGPVSGVRYKCLVCDDYDLCSVCEGKGVHVDHNMVTINEPGAYSPWGHQGWGGHGRQCGQRRGWGGCGGQGRPSPCHGRRRGWPGSHHQSPFGGHPLFGQSPFPLWGLLSGFPAAGGKPCGQQPTSQHEGSKKDEQTGGAEPMDTEQPTEEQRKAYLHNIGSTVSSFLEPLGIKVDVDVLGGEKSAEKKPDGESTTTGQSTSSGGATPFPGVPSEDAIGEVLVQLKAMGYEDEGGWLTELVKTKGGDIGKVLDALHYTETD